MDSDNDDDDDSRDFKVNLSGYIYQLKLLLLFLWHGYENRYDKFQLGTEIKEAEKFDDSVFLYKKDGKVYVRYLQAKHTRHEGKGIVYHDLLQKGKHGAFNLEKYFVSYRKIKQRNYQEEIDDLIICTNYPLSSLTISKNSSNTLTFADVSTNDNILYDGKTKEPWKKYQLQSINSCNELEEKLKASTNLSLLAKEFFYHFSTTDEKNHKLDMQNFWISSYFDVLIKENVIEEAPKLNAQQKEYYFSNAFIYDIGISQNAKKFRSILNTMLKKEMAKRILNCQLFANNAMADLQKLSTITNMSTTTNESDENAVAKILVEHIFYRKELINVFKDEYSFLKNVFVPIQGNAFKFSKDFAKNQPKFYDIFLEIFVKEILNDRKRLKFNQKFSRMIELIKCFTTSFTAAKNKPDKIIKLDKTEWKELKIEGLMEALNGSVFVALPERNMIRFCDNFWNPNNKFHNSFAEDFKKSIMKKLSAELGVLRQCKIEYSNYPPCFDTLANSTEKEMRNDMEIFRQKLFIVKSPNESELMKEVSAEIGEKFNLLDSDIITFDLFQQILNWAKGDDTLLDRNNVKAFITGIKTQISEKLESGCSLQYCKKMEEHGVVFNQTIGKIAKFIATPQIQILHIKTLKVLLTSIKVAQTLRSCFPKTDSFIFNPLSALLRMEYSFENGCEEQHVSKAFRSNADLLIIADTETKKKLIPFCKKLVEILQQSQKKIIIIAKETSSLLATMKDLVDYHRFETIQDYTNYDSLTSDSQLTIRNNTFVKFQGKDVYLKDMMDEETCLKLIDPHILQKFVSGGKIVIGNAIKTFTENEYQCYRPRKIQLIELDDKFLEDTPMLWNNTFVIEGANVENYLKVKSVDESMIATASNYVNSRDENGITFITMQPSKNLVMFKEICAKRPNNCVHWLKLENKNLIWFHSFVPPKSCIPPTFFSYTKKTKKFVDESYFGEYIKQNQVVIIADSAGMGKSTILTSFAETINNMNTLQWIIRINLNEYTETLEKIKTNLKNLKEATTNDELGLNFDNFNWKKKDYGKLVLESVLNKTKLDIKKLSFENRVFNHFFTRGKMLIMFDGYDEINPDYGENVIALLKKLKNKPENRIWITSRLSFKNALQEMLNSFAYDLKPFDEEDQKMFLKQFWMVNWKAKEATEMPNQDRLKIYVECLVRDASKIIGNIIGIPLQTKMLAEVFQDNDDKTWQSCFQYVKAVTALTQPNFSSKLSNLFMLYEDFFKAKVFKYFLQEKGILQISNPSAKGIKEQFYSCQYQVYCIFGFFELYEKHASFTTMDEKNIAETWTAKLKSGNENIGIIDSFNSDGRPVFSHLTYAEYFTACYLIDKIRSSPSNAVEIFKIINEILWKDVQVFHGSLLYKLKQEMNNKALEGKSFLSFAAHHGFINCIMTFLHHTDFNINFLTPDIRGNIALHYAAQNRQFNTVIFLTLYIYDLIQKQTNYSSMSIYYLSKFMNNNYENIICEPSTLAFFKEIEKAAKRSLMPKEHNMKAIINNCSDQLLQDYTTFNALHVLRNFIFVNITNFWEHFSFVTLINIVSSFKPKRQMKNFVDGICANRQMTNTEKTKLFAFVMNTMFEKIEKNNFAKTLFISVVDNDCSDLLDSVLMHKAFAINNEIFGIAFDIACKKNMFKIVHALLKFMKIKKLYNISVHKLLNHHVTLKMIKTIFEAITPPINCVDSDGRTFLFAALEYGCNINIIEYLIIKGSDPNIADKWGRTAWTRTVEHGDKAIIGLFMSRFKNLESKSLVATIKAYYSEFQIFDVNYARNGKSRLHQAIEDKDLALCKFLLRKHANVNIKDSNGKSPIFRAFENELFDVIKTLLFYGASYNDENVTYELKKYGKIDAISNMLNIVESNFNNISTEMFGLKSSKFIQNATNNERQTLWHIAAKSDIFENNIPISNVFKERLNDQDINGNTPLHLAVQSKNEKAVIKFLEWGAYYDIQNSMGRTPQTFTSAKLKPLFEEIDILFILAKRNDFNFLKINKWDKVRAYLIKNEEGRTFFHYAVIHNNTDAVKQLIMLGSSIYARDKLKMTPLSYAVKYNFFNIMVTLLKHDALVEKRAFKDVPKNECTNFLEKIVKCCDFVYSDDITGLKNELDDIEDNSVLNVIVNVKINIQRSMINYAQKNYEFLLYLLQKGVVIQSLIYDSDKDETSYFPATKNFVIQKLLLSLKEMAESIMTKAFDPRSLINYYENYFNCFDTYIANNIIANVRFNFAKGNDNGQTLLHLAAIANEEKVVTWLIKDKGADPYLTDWYGNDTYKLAKNNKSYSVLQVLHFQKTSFPANTLRF